MEFGHEVANVAAGVADDAVDVNGEGVVVAGGDLEVVNVGFVGSEDELPMGMGETVGEVFRIAGAVGEGEVNMDVGRSGVAGAAFDEAVEFAPGLENEAVPDGFEIAGEAGGEAVVEDGIVGPDAKVDGGVGGRGAGGALDVDDVFIGIGGDVVENDGVFAEADVAFDVIKGKGEVAKAHARVVAVDIAIELEVAGAADALEADGDVELAVGCDALDEVLTVGESDEEGRVVVAEDGIGEAEVEIERGIWGGAGDCTNGFEVVAEEPAAHVGVDGGLVHAETERAAEVGEVDGVGRSIGPRGGEHLHGDVVEVGADGGAGFVVEADPELGEAALEVMLVPPVADLAWEDIAEGVGEDDVLGGGGEAVVEDIEGAGDVDEGVAGGGFGIRVALGWLLSELKAVGEGVGGGGGELAVDDGVGGLREAVVGEFAPLDAGITQDHDGERDRFRGDRGGGGGGGFGLRAFPANHFVIPVVGLAVLHQVERGADGGELGGRGARRRGG